MAAMAITLFGSYPCNFHIHEQKHTENHNTHARNDMVAKKQLQSRVQLNTAVIDGKGLDCHHCDEPSLAHCSRDASVDHPFLGEGTLAI